MQNLKRNDVSTRDRIAIALAFSLPWGLGKVFLIPRGLIVDELLSQRSYYIPIVKLDPILITGLNIDLRI